MHNDSTPGEKKCVLGIDLGTSGVRTVARDKSGETTCAASCRYAELDGSMNVDASGVLGAATADHRSPELWWRGVLDTMGSVLARIDPSSVVAIAVDGTSGTMLPIDDEGAPLETPLMYNDPVEDAEILDAIARSMPATSAAGGATSGLGKAMLFSRLSPAAVVHQADWIVGQLTGEFRLSDANNALKTGFDPVTMRWPDWINDAGDVRALLPDVSIPGTPMTTMSASVASRFGLSGGVQLVAGTTDGCASFLATGCSDVGEAVSALGSTLTVKLLSDAPVFAPEFGVYSHRIGDQWLAGGASNTGGAVLSHYFTDNQLDELSKSMNTRVASGLDYYPLVSAGERFPISDASYKPRLEPRPKNDQQFLQGMFEGIAGIEKAAYNKLAECGGPALKSVRSVGGGADNQAFTDIRKRVLGVPFLTPVSDAAAYGTACLAARGADRLSLW